MQKILSKHVEMLCDASVWLRKTNDQARYERQCMYGVYAYGYDMEENRCAEEQLIADAMFGHIDYRNARLRVGGPNEGKPGK